MNFFFGKNRVMCHIKLRSPISHLITCEAKSLALPVVDLLGASMDKDGPNVFPSRRF